MPVALIEPMQLLPSSILPEGTQWSYELKLMATGDCLEPPLQKFRNCFRVTMLLYQCLAQHIVCRRFKRTDFNAKGRHFLGHRLGESEDATFDDMVTGDQHAPSSGQPD